jgi:uncharacterized protein (DUF362 family)
MSTQEKKGLSRRGFLGASVGAVVTAGVAPACNSTETPVGTGGTAGTSSGGSPPGTGGTSSGGVSTGGLPGGGTSAGGASAGGKSTGGVSSGGKASGGASTGGTTSSGGTSSGGKSTGGANTGGTGNDGGKPPLVALVRNTDVMQAVRDAVAMVGGLPDLTGKTVLLKPNLNSDEGPPTSPNPEVMRAAIRMVKERGATRVIVGDRSNPSYDTIQAMTKAGIYAVAVAEGAETMNFNGMTTRLVTPSGATHWPSGFNTYAVILDQVNFIINMCCCKHHALANYTMAMKAWMGIIVQNDRSTAHSDLGNRLPELHLGVKENFVILDATKALLTAGPSLGGKQASPGIVVATADAVAADATGLSIMKYYLAQISQADSQIDNYTVWTQPQMVRALALNNGWINSKSQYSYGSSGISEIQSIMQYINA